VSTVRLTMKRGLGRYSVLVVGLGAAGVAIGWLGPGVTGLVPVAGRPAHVPRPVGMRHESLARP
jgi:hypothetical protein